MKYKNKRLICSCIAIAIGLCAIMYTNIRFSLCASASKEDNNGKTRILIDPGHGGIDGGAVSRNGMSEKDVNLKIGLALKDELKGMGYDVLMTRESDRGLYTDGGKIRKKKIEDLENRCKMKKESNCDMFVSIHLNMFPESKYYGAQVWYANDKESERLAVIIQNNLKNDLDPNNNRKEKPAMEAYKILRCGTVPSVIVECGFLSNPQEEQKLRNEEYQHKIAQSIAKSIKQFYSEN